VAPAPGGGRALLVGQARDHVVQPGQQLPRFEIDVRERPDGGAQSAHGGGGVDAVPDHVTDHEPDAAP
jgi:hypothetical protein